MIITIDRHIFNALTKELQERYIYNTIISELGALAEQENIKVSYVAEGILNIITKTEQTIKKVGLKRYYNNDITADDYASGYYYKTGSIVICPFDWSMKDEDDENFEYTFTLARMI